MLGAVRDRENLSWEVSPGKYLRENLSRELQEQIHAPSQLYKVHTFYKRQEY